MNTFTKAYKKISQQQSQDQLVLQHLDYVTHILSRITAALPRNIDVENLQSAGVVGLIEAAKNFDPNRGVSFKTFSYPRIRGAILDELRVNSPLSQKMIELVRKIRETIDALDPPITVETIARQARLSVERVEIGLEAMRLNPQQWDASCIENSRSMWSTERPESPLEDEERKQLLANAIESLPERERLAVTLYYLEGLKLKEVGAVLSISESRASRVLAKAELTLKQLCGVEL